MALKKKVKEEPKPEPVKVVEEKIEAVELESITNADAAAKLASLCQDYIEISEVISNLEKDKEEIKGKLKSLHESADLPAKVKSPLFAFSYTNVPRFSLSQTKLLELGVTQKIIELATVETPSMRLDVRDPNKVTNRKGGPKGE